MRVSTWLPGGRGASGLVFGLNADWTAFYTLEVMPSSRQWAVYHFHDGWWEQLARGTLPVIQPESGHNTLELDTMSSAAETILRVNGQPVYGLAAGLEGRIGLSVASYESATEARFDDYSGLARDCALPGAQGGEPGGGM